MHPSLLDEVAPPTACAPCGLDCRCARELPAWPEFVWCTRRGAPHRLNQEYTCPFHVARRAGGLAREDESSAQPPPREELSFTQFT